MFIGREAELKTLDRFYRSNSFELLIMYGRRRTGKTKLLAEFIKDRNAIFYSAEENNDTVNRMKFQSLITEFYNKPYSTDFGHWEDAFSFIADEMTDERLIIIIDELPYLALGNPSFLSILQNSIDHHFLDKNIMLVLCGSAISFMENELVAYKSPLYGRKTGQMKIRPFDCFDAGRFFPDYSFEDRFRAYSVLGGIPHYLIRINSNLNMDENIAELMFQSSSFLYDEPRNLLHQVFRNPMVYSAIIEAIAGGASKVNDITTYIGEPQGKTSKYIKSLIELELIERRQPVTAAKTSKSIYRVNDRLFNFLYRYVYQYRGLIDQDLGENLYYNKVKEAMNNLYGYVFEDVCRQYMLRRNKKLSLEFMVERFGSWWGGNPVTKKQEEIDIVGLGEDKAIYCECKYRNEPVGVSVYDKLVERSALIPRSSKYYYIFSKAGFTQNLTEISRSVDNLTLVTMKEMYEWVEQHNE